MTNLLSTLAERIRRGETLFSAWSSSTDIASTEIMVGEGFDTALFDMQHGAFDLSLAIRGVHALAALGKPALVRIPVGEFQTASRALDAGAAAVIAPMINSAAEAAHFVDFMKFPPLGKRSWGPYRALTYSGLEPQAYLASANQFQLAIAMIETREALDALEDILAVPGIDGVFVGPSDLSITLSRGTLDPQSDAVMAALSHIAARARAHGKFASAFGLDSQHAILLRGLGYRLISVGTEAAMLQAGARAALIDLRNPAKSAHKATGFY